MSVLIDMEMPSNCDKCLYSSWSNFYQIYVCNAIRKNEPVLFGKKQVKSTDTVRSGRADNCPLVQVQPHGRLIDADALMGVIRAHDYPLKAHFNSTDNGMFTIGIQQAVDEAPTIIPAEEGET